MERIFAPGSLAIVFLPWIANFAFITCMYLSLHTAIAQHNTRQFSGGIEINPGVGLSGKPIWKARVDKLFSCAEACVKKTRCKSITFNTETRLCQLHAALLTDDNGINGQSGKWLVYSEFSWWPEQVDPACHSRPCGDYEVCVPTGQTSDGYTVICYPDGRPVCPLPWKLNGSRHVGGVNVITCDKGYNGGGNATCRENLTWTNEIQRCVPVNCPLPAPVTRLPNNTNQALKCEVEFSVDSSNNNCPVSMSVSGDLTVDSVFTISCGDGYTGGGSAICLASNTSSTIGYWNTTIQPCIWSDRCMDGGHCYKLMTRRRNWDDSKTNCERTGGQLAIVETPEEDQFIVGNVLVNLGLYQSVHIGGTDSEREDTFKWLDGTLVMRDRTAWGYDPWGCDQPNDNFGDEDCMLYMLWRSCDDHEERRLRWVDGGCSYPHPSLCEYQMD